MKTYSTKLEDIKREAHTIDASGQALGRMAVQIAGLLMGKHKTIYARHLDTGDFVTVINATKIKVTGNKASQKMYYRHSGYPGGFRKMNYEGMMEAHPERIVEFAVKGMLPVNHLRDRMLRRLKIYTGVVPVVHKPVKAAATEDKKEEKVNG
jgi:large subunit ribosomal protein L13